MSATGKETAGFTLLEILAVILLVGLISALSYPNFIRSQEKVELRYVGELLKADLQQVREEAMTHRTAQKFTLAGNNYHFKIGSLEIKRSLGKYGLSFVTPVLSDEAKPKEGTGEAEVNAKYPKEEENSLELIFDPDGSCDTTTVNWKSKNFRGSLVVNADGTSRWVF